MKRWSRSYIGVSFTFGVGPTAFGVGVRVGRCRRHRVVEQLRGVAPRHPLDLVAAGSRRSGTTRSPGCRARCRPGAGSRTRAGCGRRRCGGAGRARAGRRWRRTRSCAASPRAGVSSMPSHVPNICWYRPTWSRRSSRPATQPMPALGQADLQVGEAHRELGVQPVDRREHRPAEEEHADGVGRRVGRRGRRRSTTSPTCRHTTVPVSAHAAHERIPVAGVQRRAGRAARAARGTSPRGSPRAALRADLLGRDLPGRAARAAGSGMMRPGYVPAHSSSCQSLAARTTAQRELGIAHAELVALAREAGERRREVQRRVHAVEVHVVHAGVDVLRAAAHLVEAGRARTSAAPAACRPPR